MLDPHQTPRQQRARPQSDSHAQRYSVLRAARRTSSSALSNTSTTDYDETSDLDSLHDVTISPSPSHQSSRTTSPGDHNNSSSSNNNSNASSSSRKAKKTGLRLSLMNLRTPKSSSHTPSDIEHSPEPYSSQRSTDGSRTPIEGRISLELPRTSFDSIDPRRREHLASPPQISTSAPKTSARFSFIHSPTPSTPTMARPAHHRSSTTPTHSPNPTSYSTSPRRTMASPSPQPVKETHTMMKDYDPMTGNKMINKYMVVRELGRGVHGKVKLCRDTVTDELCAIKIVDKTTRRRLGRAQISNEQKIRREIAIMKKCIHPNVVRLIEVIDDPNARKIYLVLEYMEGGEVRWKDAEEKPILPLDDARTIFRDIVLGLEYLHMQGIIHRDIKPANLLLAGDGTVKISDFGVSHFSEKNALDHDLENAPAVEKAPHTPSGSNPFENFFRHPAPNSPLASTFSGRSQGAFHLDPSSSHFQQQQFSSATQHQQWGDDLELAKTAGSPAFFAPELCYASEFSPAMSPALSSASQTSFILTSPTPRTVPSTPTGTISTTGGHGWAPRPPITKAIDIWALGVTLYCFVYGRCPFIAETEFELFNIIPRKQPSYPDSVPGRDHVEASLKDLLSRLLEKDVGKRITLREVKEHAWVTEGLNDPVRWRIETDPGNYQRVHITEEDLKGAVTIMDKIKSRIRKLSVSLTNFTLNRRRSKSITSANPPESPTMLHSPIPIIRSPATTSQTSTHAVAQPQTYVNPMSLPERFQHFYSHSNPGPSAGSFRSDRLERPNSVCSNTSSIEEVDEGDDQSGSGSSAQKNTSYIGRRRLLRNSTHQHSTNNLNSRPLSVGSYPNNPSRRSYGNELEEQSLGLYVNKNVGGGTSFGGLPSARVVPTGHSSLSKSWVYSGNPDADAGLASGSHSQQEQLNVPQNAGSYRTTTLSPSSTLVSDILQDQVEHGYKDSFSKPPNSVAPECT
ncbi:hypothetical protein BG015_002116 [Linnemannia schmuckeri]|uniref:non-specific serine/threonine protein kinase n=1 Tax=Linnemannia schmuckeri TaxID=64567 RepID=A0A9P5V6H9_9FUNG|nr:hypothetical protein BG015_002116 [Linnemannia schmuckeri]